MVERTKHKKEKRGYKTKSNAFLNQVPILGGKGVIYTTPESNGNYYFRTWIPEEKRYVRIGLRTKDVDVAIKKGDNEMLGILTKLNQGHKVFGVSWGEVCDDFLKHQQERVNTDRITQGRYSTLSTQVHRWIVPYIGKRETVSSLNRNSFVDYGMYRRKKTDNVVEDVTIRNEYTTVNAIAKFAYRNDMIPFEKFIPEEIRIREMPRRDTFTPEEYKIFYLRLRDWVADSIDPHEVYYRKLIQDFILLKSNTFMRFGEIRLLQWHMCVIFTHEKQKLVKIKLPAHICKNRKDRTVIARGGRYLERIKERSKHTDPDDYCFSHHEMRNVLAKTTFYKYWGELMKYSKLPTLTGKKLTYYSLRHFGITARLMAKVPHYEVAKFAGTNVRHIETHYEHLDMGRMIDSATQTFSFDENGFVVRE
jgi:integrase